MALEEDAVRQALGMLTQGISPGAQSLLSGQVAGGTLGERRIGGSTSYFDPVSRLPLGAVDDPRSPMGFTIADPNLRNMYSNEMGSTASAVAQNEYMDSFERDKLKNTLAIMAASDKLDPEIQMAVMSRLGVNVPGYDQGGGGGGGGAPGSDYMGARQTGIDARGNPIITPMFAQGNPLGGYMSRRLREELAKLQFENQLKEPTTQADIRLKEQQGASAVETAGANKAYREALAAGKGDTYKQGLFNAIDNMAEKYRVASQAGPGGSPIAAQNLKQAMDFLMEELRRTGSGAGSPSVGASAGTPPPAGDLGPAAPEAPWWDRGMPSSGGGFIPNAAKIAELQRQLAYVQQYAPNDMQAMEFIQKKIQAELLPPFQNTQTPAATGGGSGITVRKNTK